VFPHNVFHLKGDLWQRGLVSLKCYCGFVCETESELKDHIIKTHGARDGDWRGWVSR
jgi:hypothetical protein